nr:MULTISPECIES: DUF4169 family protein [unclassified Rhizobium]
MFSYFRCPVSAEIVNLRQFKKKQARSDKEKQAEQNRISFGRTKQEKQLTKALNDKAERAHDQGRIEKNDDAE